jgi:uncharacterized spore protein YtfJ
MVFDRIKEMLDQVANAARVETVFGESRQVAGKTILPVARVMYGGGGGGGNGKGEEGKEGSGGGGGLGIVVKPLGCFVITETSERWLPVVDATKDAIAGAMVAIVGLMTLKKIMARRD